MHSFSDWRHLHGIDAATLEDIIAAFRSGAVSTQPYTPSEITSRRGDGPSLAKQNECYEKLVIPAFLSAFGNSARVLAALTSTRFTGFDEEDAKVPYTLDCGKGDAPRIVMSWWGRPADLICLAHETAHALQIILSDHERMTPLARETCAFLGELLVIEHARRHHPSLFALLHDVWRAESRRYLGADLDTLAAAVADPTTPYHYRQNYPLARLAAVHLFRRRKPGQLHALFASGDCAMPHLPLEAMANRAGDIANYLPPMPAPDPERPSMEAYRSLGAMVLLDIDRLQGRSEERIEAYYGELLKHLQDQTAYVALNSDDRPVGYATWANRSGDGAVTLTRQSAPFGDHLMVQKSLERHLGWSGRVAAHHAKSAQQAQIAW